MMEDGLDELIHEKNTSECTRLPFAQNPHDRFEIKSQIGKGSFGAVYCALFKATNCLVALKKCTSENFEENMQEVQILRESKHRNIVRYYGSYIHKDHFWIVMEYCGLGSINDVILLHGKLLNETHISSICKAVLQGLHYLHQTNKMHRDIKPDNILITEHGSVKLADFGVAGTFTRTADKMQTVTGTPYYIAPEVVDETTSGYGSNGDIWSLGICAIEFAQGYPPHHELGPFKVISKIQTAPPPKLENPDKFSEEFKHFIAQCLVKDPSKRPPAHVMMMHKFIASSPPPHESLRDVVENIKEKIQQAGGLGPAVKQQKQKKKKSVAQEESENESNEELPNQNEDKEIIVDNSNQLSYDQFSSNQYSVEDFTDSRNRFESDKSSQFESTDNMSPPLPPPTPNSPLGEKQVLQGQRGVTNGQSREKTPSRVRKEKKDKKEKHKSKIFPKFLPKKKSSDKQEIINVLYGSGYEDTGDL